MASQFHRGGIGQGLQTCLNGFHFAFYPGKLLFGFAGIDIGFNTFYGGGDPVLIKLAVGTDDIFLLVFNLRENLPHRGLGLPLPVKPRDAAGQQLTRLLHLGFLGVDLADAGFNLRAVFAPQIEIPARCQAKCSVGVPRPGRTRGRIGNGERSHQPFRRHFLPFRIG